MGRVLKIGAVVMGVLLVVMTGGMELIRSRTSAPESMVVWEVHEGQQQFYWRLPEFQIKWAITPQFQMMNPIGTSPDGQWIYFEAKTAQDPAPFYGETVRIYRVQRNGRNFEVISDYTRLGHSRLSPNGRYLIYPAKRLDGSSQLRRVQVDGKDEIAITPPIDPADGMVAVSHFSSNSEWAYFDKYLAGEGVIWRARLDGKNAEVIANGSLVGPTRFRRTRLDDWLFLVDDRAIYQVRPDGSELRKVTPFALEKSGYERLITVANEPAVAIIESGGYTLLGVSLESNKILWRLPDYEYLRAASDDDWWWFYKRDSGELARMRPDGSDFATVATLPAFAEVWDWLPNGKLLIRASLDDVEYDAWLLAVDIKTGDIQIVTKLPIAPKFGGWSPEKQWLLYYREGGDYNAWWWRVRADGKVIESLAPYETAHWLVDWLPPMDYHWQPKLLLGVGVALGGAGVMKNNYRRLRQITQKRPSPAE